MIKLSLPQGHCAGDRMLAERVATRLGLRELTVCHLQPRLAALPVSSRGSGTAAAPGGLFAELAVGFALLLNAVVDALTDRGRARV